MYTAAIPSPENTTDAFEPPSSPARSTSAQAVPSGYGSTPCSSTINALRSGIMNKTPNVPPTSAIRKISKSPGASIPSTPSAAHKNNAGNVKIAPAATDSPAEPIVCTMLFSKIESLLRITRIIPIERTAAGIDADTVIPTLSPRYAFAAPKTTAKRIPMNSDVNVNSGTILSAEINGLKSFLLSIFFSPILYYFNALSPKSIIAPFCP